ncbi:hypothetical protein KV557_24725 [Kitasatospora aureofaciens]|uniref:hypothetical protein n=1 Tax=Kitasatospora aureofaciens TaxID=1894 RepID=UPI001C4821A3|nr:hypothetical protein [Kitasatospora aureofaciens]MBV6700270.1 hypothetical protein [Kitasatospora aureofaciens]
MFKIVRTDVLNDLRQELADWQNDQSFSLGRIAQQDSLIGELRQAEHAALLENANLIEAHTSEVEAHKRTTLLLAQAETRVEELRRENEQLQVGLQETRDELPAQVADHLILKIREVAAAADVDGRVLDLLLWLRPTPASEPSAAPEPTEARPPAEPVDDDDVFL